MKRVSSSKNFASKIGFFESKPSYYTRSKKTQEALEKSKKFYVQEEVKKQTLLEQQLSYREKELSRPPVEKPSNVITLKNGTRWIFDINKQRYINVDTKEELTVSQYMTYTAMIAMIPEDQEYDDEGDTLVFGISNIDVSFDGSELSIGQSVTASPSTVGGSATSFSYSWSIV